MVKYVCLMVITLVFMGCNPVENQALGEYVNIANPQIKLYVERFDNCGLKHNGTLLKGEWSVGPVDSKSANYLEMSFDDKHDKALAAVYQNDTLKVDYVSSISFIKDNDVFVKIN